MKKGMLALFVLALMLSLSQAVWAEQAEDGSEWTVLIYMCGSDLESKYSCGTENLEEISRVRIPENTIPDIIINTRELSDTSVQSPGKVNVLIETGGAKAWHAQDLGMDIRSDALQIWRYDATTDTERGTFSLEEERPLDNMASPDTLSEFIRWGTEHYPAKKYGLVLWSHGGGSATGIFIDELFDCEFMTLDSLNLALAQGGTHFEAVLFDACMMANLETACAIQDHANWMIASEELVAGKGTAIGDWLQQLYYLPTANGRLLGRWICDTAMIKYGNSEERQSQELLTWSLINLSQVKQLEKSFDMFFERVNLLYTTHPEVMVNYAYAPFFSEAYGTGHENMFDIAGIMYQPLIRSSTSEDTQMMMQEALANVVDYCVRGSGRPSARGISFCYATNFSNEKLDIYARNCPSPHYLALLDAISSWNAPDWVFEQAEKLPELDAESAYHITVEKKIWENGSPAFSIVDGENLISMVQYNLYREDEVSRQIICLGEVPVYYDPDVNLYRVYDLLTWPAFEGHLCEIKLQNIIMDRVYNLLYNIPMLIDSEPMNMRCAYWFDRGVFEVLGVWEGYDNDSSLFNRNVKSLAQLAGREFRLAYEVANDKRSSKPFVLSPPMTLYRSMKLEVITLPPGNYYIEFVVYDVFKRPMRMEMVKLQWDGKNVSIQSDPWEGTITLHP